MKKVVVFSLFLCFTINKGWAETKPNFEIAEEVLQELYQAFGHLDNPMPKIEFSKKNLVGGAAYYPLSNKIVLDKQVFSVCSYFGADSLSALAFIIGHELSHAFQASSDSRVVTNFLAYDNAPGTSYHLEKAADIQGLFGAYLAGYSSHLLFTDLIDKLYETYQLKGIKLEGYPSFEERLQTVDKVEGIVDTLIQLYEISNYLVALGQYDFAKSAYSYLTTYFRSPELLNNFGANCLLWAMHLSQKSPDPFILPLELDWNSRLQKPPSRGIEDLSPEEVKQRQFYTDLALRSFEEALKMNPDHPMIRLNNLCGKGVRGNWTYVVEKAKELSENYEGIYRVKFRQLAGIGLGMSGNKKDREEAISIFSALGNHSNPGIAAQASFNKAVLTQKIKGKSYFREPMERSACGKWYSGKGVALNTYRYNLQILLDEENYFYYEKNNDFKIFNFLSALGQSVTIQRFEGMVHLVEVPEDMNGFNSLEINRGRTIFICRESGVAFLLDENGEPKEWIKYSIN